MIWEVNMEGVRFVSRCAKYMSAGLTITPRGVTVADPDIIKLLRESADCGSLFFEVKDEKDLAKEAIEFAKEILAIHAVEVPPVSGISEDELEAELEAAAENERIKTEQKQAEEALWQAKSEKAEAFSARKGRRKKNA